MDRHGHVGRCFHGHTELPSDKRRELYLRERVRTSLPPYAWIDTLFALPEVVMYCALVEYQEKASAGPVDYDRLWQDIREAIDEAHRDESMTINNDLSVLRSQSERRAHERDSARLRQTGARQQQ